ncbi:MAG: acylphosphatase [Gammaproteobacteria bacterium]|nr:MAG: acylphosphatase [Gammaproteobacteria bacterium]
MTSADCRHYLVSGRVQGVFYRASAQAEGERLGLDGWVRNLPDGRVEAVACGDAEMLERFESWLRKGPAFARVTALAVQAWSGDVPGEGFRVVASEW